MEENCKCGKSQDAVCACDPMKYIEVKMESPSGPKPCILEDAKALVTGARVEDYGTARESFGRIAKLWSAALGVEISPTEVALCMILLKVSREINGHKRDSLVDIAGYAKNIEILEEV